MAQSSNSGIFNARDFGATGDGDTKDSPAIQSAIDACTATGGGVVLVPPGEYRCGTIHLKSHVVLEISAGATLHYSTDEDDFEEPEELPYSPNSDVETAYFRFSLLFGQDAQNIAIQGPGAIEQHTYGRGGPKPMAFKNCQDVTIRDFFILNAPNYNISMIGCDNVT
ncbi:MAG TPA: glycosyl hydrolase family 28-related protein, partial [Candidatus Lokiarchaeia archaeon]|nr:glycosyl hydrolase family 28-related protein [Candidatus Lokiarchaeia archaeon]